MEVRVRFSYDKRTGEVKEFTVEQEKLLPHEEHDRHHERAAAEIGSVVQRNPRVVEMSPVHADKDKEKTTPKPSDDRVVEADPTREREKGT